MQRFVLTATLALVAAAFPTSSLARADLVRWFHSPTGNIQCEVASADPRGTYAYCQTFSPLQTATLKPNGRTAVCSRHACSVGDGPTNARSLAYGSSVTVGVFRCSSSRTGMRCVVAATGRGFTISRTGITFLR